MKKIKSKEKVTPNTITALIASRLVGAIKREVDAITQEMQELEK